MLFGTPVTLSEGQDYSNTFLKKQNLGFNNNNYDHTNWNHIGSCTSECTPTLKYLMQSVKQRLFPFFPEVSLKSIMRMLACIALTQYHISSSFVQNCARKGRK